MRKWIFTSFVAGTRYHQPAWWLVTTRGCPAGPHRRGEQPCGNCFAVGGPREARR